MKGPTLTASSRNSDPDYAGVLRNVSKDYRVAVNPDGTRYQLQKRWDGPDGEAWVPRAYATLSALLKSQADKVEGLAVACDGLPEKPETAVSQDLKAQRAEIMDRIKLTDWRRNDYGRNIRQDANIRLAVDPAGAEYRLQWIETGEYRAGGSDNWRTIKKGPMLSELLDHLHRYAVTVPESREDREGFEDRCEALIRGFPQLVTDGDWPELPDRY